MRYKITHCVHGFVATYDSYDEAWDALMGFVEDHHNFDLVSVRKGLDDLARAELIEGIYDAVPLDPDRHSIH